MSGIANESWLLQHLKTLTIFSELVCYPRNTGGSPVSPREPLTHMFPSESAFTQTNQRGGIFRAPSEEGTKPREKLTLFFSLAGFLATQMFLEEQNGNQGR